MESDNLMVLDVRDDDEFARPIFPGRSTFPYGELPDRQGELRA